MLGNREPVLLLSFSSFPSLFVKDRLSLDDSRGTLSKELTNFHSLVQKHTAYISMECSTLNRLWYKKKKSKMIKRERERDENELVTLKPVLFGSTPVYRSRSQIWIRDFLPLREEKKKTEIKNSRISVQRHCRHRRSRRRRSLEKHFRSTRTTHEVISPRQKHEQCPLLPLLIDNKAIVIEVYPLIFTRDFSSLYFSLFTSISSKSGKEKRLSRTIFFFNE